MYNPIPPRVWSRVQNPCTYYIDSSYSSVYIPLTNQTTSLAIADIETKIQYKGNILQYKANSSCLTKKQKYSQITKGLWCNKTKVFATQTQIYSNPNTTGLKRINSVNIPYPNDIVGYPNNPSGPFLNNDIIFPFDCSNNYIQDGGSLLCNSYTNPCTNIVTQNVYQRHCALTYSSDVPGKPISLCWNPKQATYFPRQRYIMSNSANKWPQGYKGLVSATVPSAPTLSVLSTTENNITLIWSVTSLDCIPISSFNIYQNNKFVKNVSYTVLTYSLDTSSGDTFYVTSISKTVESSPSNIITFSN
jgi:hypothetical protein